MRRAVQDAFNELLLEIAVTKKKDDKGSKTKTVKDLRKKSLTSGADTQGSTKPVEIEYDETDDLADEIKHRKKVRDSKTLTGV